MTASLIFSASIALDPGPGWSTQGRSGRRACRRKPQPWKDASVSTDVCRRDLSGYRRQRRRRAFFRLCLAREQRQVPGLDKLDGKNVQITGRISTFRGQAGNLPDRSQPDRGQSRKPRLRSRNNRRSGEALAAADFLMHQPRPDLQQVAPRHQPDQPARRTRENGHPAHIIGDHPVRQGRDDLVIIAFEQSGPVQSLGQGQLLRDSGSSAQTSASARAIMPRSRPSASATG